MTATYTGTLSATSTGSDPGVNSNGSATYSAIYGYAYPGSNKPAISGTGSAGNGVYGSTSASSYGAVAGSNTGTGGYGVYGIASNTSGGCCGIYGESNDSSGSGVHGANGAGTGVRGLSQGYLWAGVEGKGFNTSGCYGVYGGVFAPNNANCWAGWFAGKVYIQGAISKPGGGFLIDHPLDPANKTLEHSFVESPERKNIYDGVAIADEKGEIAIRLPDYFGALNTDFRYQLTALGTSAPVFVKQEIEGGQFLIAGAQPGQRVCWMVTGNRKDAWALANLMEVETDKPERERGTYHQPHAFGLSREKDVGMARHPHLMTFTPREPAKTDQP